MDWDRAYSALTKRNWVILLILAALSALFMSHLATLGVILGGLISIINFDVLQHTIKHAFPSKKIVKTKKTTLIVKGYLRLSALAAAIYFLLKYGMVDPIGLAIGLTTVVFSIVSFGISSACKTRTGGAT
jgi:hypothetical protein